MILRCLEVDTNERYGSAAQVAFDLANPGQVALTERAERRGSAGLLKTAARWFGARNYVPSPAPAPATAITPLPVIVVALSGEETSEPFYEALRAATRRRIVAEGACRVACITVVPTSAGLADDTPTGRHIKQLVSLRRWAKPLALPEERLTYHVLESDEPVAALVDYATVNEVQEIVLGPDRHAAALVARAPCSVSVVRAPPPG